MVKKGLIKIVAAWFLVQFVFISTSSFWQNIALAESESVESIVQFQAYFQEQDQVKSKLLIERQNELVISLSLKKQGILKDVVLQLKQANFRIKTEEVNDNRIQEIDPETGNMVLTPIPFGTKVQLTLPIEFKPESRVNINYFSEEIQMSLQGNYQQDEKLVQKVEQDLLVSLQWSSEVMLQATEEVEKYRIVPERGVLLQTKLETEVTSNLLPKQQETLSVQTVRLKDQYPKEVVVLVNGKKRVDGVSYQAKTGKLVVNRDELMVDDVMDWGTGKDTYQILSYYDETVGIAQTTISLASILTSKLATQDVQTETMERELTIKPMGNVADLSLEATNQLVKGYLYARADKETPYQQKETIGISDVSQLREITVTEETPYFVNDQKAKLNAKSSVYYQKTEIAAEELISILGEKGKLVVKPSGENNMVIAEVTAKSPVHEGKFEIVYEGTGVHELQFIFSDLAQEGKVTLVHQKAILGNTGYDRSTLKKVEALEQKVITETALGQETKQIHISLLDTEPKASLSVSQEQWQTLQTNDHMTIDFTFLSHDPSQDLYRNPTLQVELPAGIEEITVNSINKAHSDEFEITKAGMITNQQGKKVLQVHLQGNQENYQDEFTKGLQISFDISVRMRKDIPTHQEEIIAYFTNENRVGQVNEQRKTIDIVSKYGVLAYTKVQDYNGAGEKQEATNGKIQMASLDLQAEEKTVSGDMILVNNYESSLGEVSFIGYLPGKSQKTWGDSVVESSGDTFELKKVDVNLEGVEVWYSPENNPTKDSHSWSQELTGAKAFKLVLPGNQLAAGGVISVHLEFTVQEKLENQRKAYLGLETSYQYEGKQALAYSGIQFVARNQDMILGNSQEETPEEVIYQVNGLTVKTQTTSAGKAIKDGETVYEGQVITYRMEVTNQSGQQMRNINLIANHTNAIFYGYVEKQVIPTVGEEDVGTEIFYEEDESIKQKEITIDNLKPGESIIETYEFSVRNRDGSGKTEGSLEITADHWQGQTITLFHHPMEEAQLKVKLNFTVGADKVFETRTSALFGVEVQNLTKEVQDVDFYLPFPDYLTFNTEEMDSAYEFVSADHHVLHLKINQVPGANEQGEAGSVGFIVVFGIQDFSDSRKQDELSLTGQVENQSGRRYTSNTITKIVKASEKGLSATLEGDVKKEPLTNGTKVTLTGILLNLDDIDYHQVTVNQSIPSGFVLQKVYVEEQEGNQQEIPFEEFGDLAFTIDTIKANAQVKFVIEGIIDTQSVIEGENQISIRYYARADFVEYFSNLLTYQIQREEPENPDGPDEPEGPEVPDNPDHPDVPVEETHTISGMVWIDANKNGLRDKEEEVGKNQTVVLFEIKPNGEVNRKEQTQTDQNGYYEFVSLPQGQYVVGFAYDTSKFRMTQYQKEGVHETINSDIFSSQVYENQTFALTDLLTIEKEEITHIDAGFIQNEIFDLSLAKYISQVVVKYPSGVKVYQYDKARIS